MSRDYISYKGTVHDSFAIGNSLVELKNINNELYFRLPNGTYTKVIGEAQFNSLSRSLRQWQSSTFFAANEAIIYNGILYICLNDHTSSGSFEADQANFSFISVFDGFLLITPTPSATTNLDKTSGTLIYIDNAPGSGVYRLRLPNALTIQFGHKFKIINTSDTYSVEIYYYDDVTQLATVAPNTSREIFYVKPNSSNGIFDFTDALDSANLVVTQVAHGFTFGDLVYIENATGLFKLAQANDRNKTCDAIVSAVYNANSFQVTFAGEVNGNFPLIPIVGEVYFLSDSVAGDYTNIEPIGISQPVFKAITTNKILFRPDRPSENIASGVAFTIADGASISLGADSCQYIIYLEDDPRVLADVRYLSGFTPELDVLGIKPIASSDTPANLCIFDASGQLFVKNNLGVTKTIFVFKNFVSP